jgi:hypothetical protein
LGVIFELKAEIFIDTKEVSECGVGYQEVAHVHVHIYEVLKYFTKIFVREYCGQTFDKAFHGCFYIFC